MLMKNSKLIKEHAKTTEKIKVFNPEEKTDRIMVQYGATFSTSLLLTTPLI